MKYIKKPIPVEAVQIYAGQAWDDMPEWYKEAYRCSDIYYANTSSACRGVMVKTLEGDVFAAWGSYIVKGIEGELWPVRGDIFEKTYVVYEE